MNLWRLPLDERSGKLLGAAEAVTTPSPYSAHVSISSDGRRIAYVQWVSADSIEKIAFDPAAEKVVGEAVAVTQSSKPAFFPDPSPDGQWLACSYERPEDIYVIKTDGSGLRQLTDDDFIDRFPRWSPDGNWIAFMSDRSGKQQIWVIHADGSGLRQLTYEREGVVAGAVWSPDGRRLVYNRSGDVPRIIDFGKGWRGQTPESLPFFGDGGFWARSWSPNGKMIAGHPPGGSATTLYSMTERPWTNPPVTQFGFVTASGFCLTKRMRYISSIFRHGSATACSPWRPRRSTPVFRFPLTTRPSITGSTRRKRIFG
jgi:hypothetical protein